MLMIDRVAEPLKRPIRQRPPSSGLYTSEVCLARTKPPAATRLPGFHKSSLAQLWRRTLRRNSMPHALFRTKPGCTYEAYRAELITSNLLETGFRKSQYLSG